MNDRYKFLISGGSNTAITYAIYVALVSAGLNYNAALFIVYPIGIALGYIVNRCWTFADTFADKNAAETNAKSTHTQLFQYIVAYGLVFLVNLSSLNFLVQIFDLTPILAQLIAIAISTVCSYFLQKTWVFKSYSKP